MREDQNWIKSPWTISIGTAMFSLFLTVVYDYSKNKPILSTMWKILKAVFNFFISILNFNIKVWWLLAAIIALILTIYLIDRFKQDENFRPDFCNYREGKFKRWRWTWNWKWSRSVNAWVISDLTAHCPNCDTPLIENVSIYELSYDCPRCDFRASASQCDEPHKIERIILDNINRQRRDT